MDGWKRTLEEGREVEGGREILMIHVTRMMKRPPLFLEQCALLYRATSLHAAAYLGHLLVVDLLLQRGARL